MTRSLRSAWLHRRMAVLLATATIGASFGWALAPGSSSAQTADPPFTVEVSQTSGLLDGDMVEVTVRANSGARLEHDSDNDMYICRPGVSYTSIADTRASNGNCPATAVSSSSEAQARFFTVADGSRAVGDISVGIGFAEWTPAFGLPNATLDCGPRRAVLARRAGAGIGWWRSGDRPLRRAGAHVHRSGSDCRVWEQEPGGRDDSRVGPDVGPVGALDAGAVRSGAAAGASTSYAPAGEGEGLAGFAEREPGPRVYRRGVSADHGAQPLAERAAVYTPVALNAVVIAAMGGRIVSDDPQWPVGLPKPYSEPIRMTAAEAATLVGQGLLLLQHRQSSAPPSWRGTPRSATRCTGDLRATG